MTCSRQLSRLGGLKWETTKMDFYTAATSNCPQGIQAMSLR
ncbi:hypothetical protein PDR5_42640 [Pseudomonas sp. DR 5-09]|nr:hypothetical protein PDR5_42640 [Pseudomonas sp. DR 5-09]